MSITSISRDWGQGPSLVRVTSTDTIAQVATAGYLLAQHDNIVALNSGEFGWIPDSDMVLIVASDGWGFFTVSADEEDFDAFAISTTVVGAPVVVGDFAVFQSTSGNIEDLGYLPSDASKTSVVMASAAVIANHIACFSDTAGTVNDDSTTAINGGNIQAGLSGTAGYLASFPATGSKGSLRLTGVANTNDDVVTISNALHGQATVYSIPDVGAATGQLLNKTAALVDGNFIAASGTAGKTVDSGYNVDNVLLYASVAITAAQWNGMYAAPKLLIAAPGANKMIIVDRAELVMTFVSAAYANGGIVGLQYDNTTHGGGVAASNTQAAADFFAAASTVFQFNGVSGNTVAIAPFTTAANKGIYISNLTGAFDTGDSTWVAKIHYRIIATA